ncbi:MAG: cyclopentanol dehydrogenase [Chloroflexi bacterium]|nr:cyclopentanol dehydrogenase [Chloroflexota bacterium]
MVKDRLEGKIALISGGTGGQGSTEVKLFCQEGAKVVFGDIDDEKGKKLESEVRKFGGEATYVHLDVTSESDWQKAVSKTIELYGKLNILINNAGILITKRLEETTESDWDLVQSVNAKGVFLGAKSVISAMKNSGGGSIVNISSIAGLVGRPWSAYTASKGAVRLLTKSIAVQYGPDRIRCNSVHPGIVNDNAMGELTLANFPDSTEDLLIDTPLRRFAVSKDIAMGVLYLASDESSYVTGSELSIDGGTYAK